MYEVPIIRSVEGNTIVVSHPAIPDQPDTFLTVASLASAVSLTVLDNGVFANTNYIVVGPLAANRTELLTINGAITPGTGLTITAATFPHPADTPVVKTLWNQVEISGATTATGTKNVITTISIQYDRRETTYTNVGTTYAFYFVRFKNSVSGVFSEYSDPASAGGYATNTLRAVKDEALRMTKDIIGKVVTDDWMNQEIFNCEEEVWAERKRWKWATKFGTILGDTITGQGSVELPTDIADSFSDQAIYGFRISGRPNMERITKEEYDKLYINVEHSNLALPIVIGNSTITLEDSTDFDDSGSVAIQDSSYTFTANDRSTGVLTLSAAVTLAADEQVVGTDVWSDVLDGEPVYYTVYNGRAYFSSPISSQWSKKNIMMDYYSKPVPIDSDNDTLNIPDFTIYHYYLAWKIALARTNGEPSNASQNFMNLYLSRKTNLKRIETSGQRASLRPRKNGIFYPRNPDVRIVVTPGSN